MPGMMRACSTPATMNSGHKMSRNDTAANRTGNETRGDARFAMSPTAKWPTNTLLAVRRRVGRALGHAQCDQAFALNATRVVGLDVVAMAGGALAMVGADRAFRLLSELVDLFRRQDAALLENALLLDGERRGLPRLSALEALGLATREFDDLLRNPHRAPVVA